MEMIKNGFRWALRNFFFIATLIFIPFYIRWFWLTPSIINLVLWSGLIIANVIIAFILKKVTTRTCFGKLCLAISIIFLTANSLSVYFNMPKVVDYEKYDGASYYLVKHPHYFDPPVGIV